MSALVGIAKQISKVVEPIYIPTSSDWEFQLVHMLTNMYYQLFNFSQSSGVYWYLVLVLIYISLMTK